MIALLGDDIDDRMAVSGVKWLHSRNCNVMTMAPSKKDYGHHSYPLERFEKAISVIRQKRNTKIGIVGASTTGMLALVAASHYYDAIGALFIPDTEPLPVPNVTVNTRRGVYVTYEPAQNE